ncbi:MAG: type II toxin-antitoxin system YoeB family toxin [Thiolinea sp.]
MTVSIGKPEPLKHNGSGYLSRGTTSEHRLVYQAESDQVLIAQCRFITEQPVLCLGIISSTTQPPQSPAASHPNETTQTAHPGSTLP